MNRVSNDVDNVDNVVTGTLTSIVTNVVLIATTLVAMFLWNWRLALISDRHRSAHGLSARPVGRRMYQIRKKTREKRDEIESITQETLSISGITLIKSFAREAYKRSRFYRRRHAAHAARGRSRDGRSLVHRIGHRYGRRRPRAGWFGGRLAASASGYRSASIVAFVSFIQGRLRTSGRAGGNSGADRQRARSLRAHLRLSRHEARRVRPSERSRFPSVAGDIRFEDVVFAYDAGATSRDVLPSTCGPEKSRRSSGLRARARRRSRSSCRGSTTRKRPRPRRRPRLAQSHARFVAARHRHRHAGDLSLSRHRRQQSSLRQARRYRCRARSRAARRTSPTSSPRSPRDTTPSSASADTSSRAANASGSRSRASAQGPAHPHSRRSNELARLRKRSRDSASAGGRHARPHQPRDRAPLSTVLAPT